MSELKSFPFCGGEANAMYQRTRNGIIVYVECSSCESRTRAKVANGKPEADGFWEQWAVERVKEIWNRRVNNES